MAAPAFGAKTMIVAAKAKSLTVTIPATTPAGAAVYVTLKVAIKGTITPPAGWTPTAKQRTMAVETWTLGVWQLPNWNGVTTTYEFTWGGTEVTREGCIWSVSGADTTSPTSATSSAEIKEITPATKNATIPAYIAPTKENRPFTVVWNNEGATVTPGAGYTEDGDQVDGPQICHKTEAPAAEGEIVAVTHTVSITGVLGVLGFSVQPPQTATAKVPAMML